MKGRRGETHQTGTMFDILTAKVTVFKHFLATRQATKAEKMKNTECSGGVLEDGKVASSCTFPLLREVLVCPRKAPPKTRRASAMLLLPPCKPARGGAAHSPQLPLSGAAVSARRPA